MRIEQEQGDLGGVKPRLFRNHGKWRRLVGRCAGLGGCHNVTRRTPPLRQPFAIIRIRSKSLKGENNNAQRNAVTEAKHMLAVIMQRFERFSLLPTAFA